MKRCESASGVDFCLPTGVAPTEAVDTDLIGVALILTAYAMGLNLLFRRVQIRLNYLFDR